MSVKAKLALEVADVETANLYFSFRLKNRLVNEQSVYQEPSRILVLSDIGSSLDEFITLLKKTGIIDRKFQWIFEEGHLVIMGNSFKQGSQMIECLWLIYSLEDKAQRKGGYVHYILGDYEIMNINGEWRYLQPRYATKLKKPPSSYLVLYDGNQEIWRWLHTKNVVEKIGDVLFTYGGISNAVNQVGLSINEINHYARQYYMYRNRILRNSLLQSIFGGNDSPVFYQGYCTKGADEAQVDVTLEKFQTHTIITGNGISGNIMTHYSGKVINTNEKLFDAERGVLLIMNNRFYTLAPDGSREKLK